MIAKFKAFYAKLTPAQRARLWTLFVTGLGGIAAVGDNIKPTPFLPNWVIGAWPVILAADLAILKVIAIFSNPNTPQTPPANPPQ